MTKKTPRFEDVFPNGDFSNVMLVFRGVWKTEFPGGYPFLFLELGENKKDWLVERQGLEKKTRWWFQIFFIFTPTWGRFPI